MIAGVVSYDTATRGVVLTEMHPAVAVGHQRICGFNPRAIRETSFHLGRPAPTSGWTTWKVLFPAKASSKLEGAYFTLKGIRRFVVRSFRTTGVDSADASISERISTTSRAWTCNLAINLALVPSSPSPIFKLRNSSVS